MRVEYINAFVKASYFVLSEILGSDQVRRGAVSLKKDSQSFMGLVAIIGITGEAEGRVLLDMTELTAISLASAMNEETFSEIDEMVQATIQELANIVTARAITELQEQKFFFDITPPAIFLGKKMRIAIANQTIVVCPMETNHGLISVNISLFERSV